MKKIIEAIKKNYHIVVGRNHAGFYKDGKLIKTNKVVSIGFADIIGIIKYRKSAKKTNLVIPTELVSVNTMAKLVNNGYDIAIDSIGHSKFYNISWSKSSKRIKLSSDKAEAIKEAALLWKNNPSRNDFMSELFDAGWKHLRSGSYKKAFSKNGIIVKFDRNRSGRKEVDLEYMQYLKASPAFKKHLAKIYFLYDGLMVQEEVTKKKHYSKKIQNEAHSIAIKFSLFDWSHNYGLSKNGRVVFHDLVDSTLDNSSLGDYSSSNSNFSYVSSNYSNSSYRASISYDSDLSVVVQS